MTLSPVCATPPNARWMFAVVAACAVALTTTACAPALDWRETRWPDVRVLALFPCKPHAQDRRVQLAGESVRLVLQACTAGGQTWALASAEMVDPARVEQALNELSTSAAANIGAAQVEAAGMQVPGATPNPASRRSRLQGALPDGKQVQMQLAVFVHGTTVFQATVVGEQVPEDAAQTFFSGLRFPA